MRGKLEKTTCLIITIVFKKEVKGIIKRFQTYIFEVVILLSFYVFLVNAGKLTFYYIIYIYFFIYLIVFVCLFVLFRFVFNYDQNKWWKTFLFSWLVVDCTIGMSYPFQGMERLPRELNVLVVNRWARRAGKSWEWTLLNNECVSLHYLNMPRSHSWRMRKRPPCSPLLVAYLSGLQEQILRIV